MHSSVVPYNKVTCDCGLELCKKIGYCQRGRFTLPVDDKKRQAWFDMAGMNANADATARPVVADNALETRVRWIDGSIGRLCASRIAPIGVDLGENEDFP